jgi:hypothetical protein
MSPENRRKLAKRVHAAAGAALAAQHHVSPIDVLVGMGWLDPEAVKRWRRGEIHYLERVVQANLSRISEAMKLVREWAVARGLSPSESAYVVRKQRRPLRFSKSGHPALERQYRTHWVSKKHRTRAAEPQELMEEPHPPGHEAPRPEARVAPVAESGKGGRGLRKSSGIGSRHASASVCRMPMCRWRTSSA